MGVTTTYKIYWKNIQLGDHAYLSYSYTGNCDIRIIPRGKGVKIWSTKDLGGGYTNITVNAFVVKDSRKQLEEYFKNLDSTFELNEKGNIIIVDKDGNSYTINNCYLQSMNQEDNDLKINRFTMKFIKSL